MSTTAIKPDYQVKFERFWSKWPSRVTESGRVVKLNIVAAQTWFAVHRPNDALFEQIMAGVEVYAKAQKPQWIQDAFRWLGKKRWMDEYGPPPKPKPHLPMPHKVDAVQIGTLLSGWQCDCGYSRKSGEDHPKGIRGWECPKCGNKLQPV